MAKKRTWGTPYPAIIVDHGDAHRVSEVMAQHGEIAVTYPANRADARRLQRRVQNLAYKAGYRFNWLSTIVDDPDYVRGEAGTDSSSANRNFHHLKNDDDVNPTIPVLSASSTG